MDGSVTGVCEYIDLAVPDTGKAARKVETGTKAADTCEHIEVADQIIGRPLSEDFSTCR